MLAFKSGIFVDNDKNDTWYTKIFWVFNPHKAGFQLDILNLGGGGDQKICD